MPALLRPIPPDPSLPLPAPSAYRNRVAGIALGMTESEVLALCSHRDRPTIQAEHAAMNRDGEEVSADSGPNRLLGGSYLRAMTCFSHDTGLTQIKFGPPPLARVVQIDHSDRTLDGAPKPLATYLGALKGAYGEPADQIGPEPIRDGRYAQTYKWLFTKSPVDLDCAPHLRESGKDVYGAALLKGMPCATELTVRLAIEDDTSVFAADVKTLNLRQSRDAERNHFEQLNAQYGTHLVDTVTERVEQLGSTILCINIVTPLLQHYLTSKREQFSEALAERLFPDQDHAWMEKLIEKSGIDDRLFADPSHHGAEVFCQAAFAMYDQHGAGDVFAP